jgi:hypothetical protein
MYDAPDYDPREDDAIHDEYLASIAADALESLGLYREMARRIHVENKTIPDTGEIDPTMTDLDALGYIIDDSIEALQEEAPSIARHITSDVYRAAYRAAESFLSCPDAKARVEKNFQYAVNAIDRIVESIAACLTDWAEDYIPDFRF